MLSLSALLDMAKESLLVQQTGLYVTGNNIANANTEGYSRQKVIIESATPVSSPVGPIGMGARVSRIEREFDRFIFSQVNKEQMGYGRYRAATDVLSRVEQLLGEFSSGGLNNALNQFFNSVQDLANNPAGATERAALVTSGQTLAYAFKGLNTNLVNVRSDVNAEIKETLKDINLLAVQIAELNGKIAESEIGSSSESNDLRDRRDKLVQQLAEKIDFTSFFDGAGHINIILSGGRPLVEGVNYGTLSAQENASNYGLYDVIIEDMNGIQSNITGAISGGRVGGLLRARDTNITGYINSMNTLANELIEEFNRVHTLGRGLQGFTSLTSANSVSDPAAGLAAAGLPFTPSAGSFNVIVTDGSGNAVTTNVSVLGGTNDTLNDLATALDGIANIGASVSNGTLTMTANSGYTFAFSGDTSDILMALGLNTFFAGYNSGNVAVNPVLVSDQRLIAAARSGSPGDNTNALALAGLQNSRVLNGGTSTMNEYYGILVGQVGIDVDNARSNLHETDFSLQQLINARASKSSVSLDEEAVNLILFQRAFQASSKLITTADDLLDIIINMI